MLDATVRKEISILREIALEFAQRATEVLNTGSELPDPSFKKGGLNEQQRAKLLAKRRKSVSRTKYKSH